MTSPLHVSGTGAICSIGIGVAQVWAAVRAGLSRSAASSIHDRFFEPLTMALLPDDALDALLAGVPEAGPTLTSRQRRMLAMARAALEETLAAAPPSAPCPVFLAWPEETNGASPSVSSREWLEALLDPFERLDASASQIFPLGRAAGFHALAAAGEFLRSGRGSQALVLGVDSFCDLRLLAGLDMEGRILSRRVSDSFVPGEGAACVALSSRARKDGLPGTALRGLGVAEDEGHRYAEAPGKGEGLTGAIERLRASMPPPSLPAEVIFAGLNGENFGAKEWGVANLRHRDLFSAQALIEHPADCFGDVGAATAPLLLALADASLLLGHREGPAFVWASSDRAPRGCAWLDLGSS